METTKNKLHEGCILIGSLFNEPMRLETMQSTGDGIWSLGLVGTQSERFRKVTLSGHDLESLTIYEAGFGYDGDGHLLRLGIQAHSLGIAWEFDPYFGLSISRVDPLPHQLEAVYDYLLKLARVRFLLADDPGAGKTIMSGLLIRELQLRGLAERVLIVCPANLSFQWQRELKEKFDEKFLVMKGGDIRDQFGVNQWMEQEFKDGNIQMFVATEAAGEGINLQVCNILFNYDIPWNPNRLEQRMGRIHRYGQRKDCLIFNFAATNTILLTPLPQTKGGLLKTEETATGCI